MPETFQAEHVPRCNEKCEGDMHYLEGDGPEVMEQIEQLPPGEFQWADYMDPIRPF